MSEDMDLKLASLLALPKSEPDPAFADRVMRAVLAERKLAAARRAAWTRFAAEMCATGAAIVAFVLLARFSPAESGRFIPLFSPAAAGLLLLGLWVAVSIRPAESQI
ncbi:MAG TPA: hypothetical protein VIT45_13435 [Allosphingosinicella sp.]